MLVVLRVVVIQREGHWNPNRFRCPVNVVQEVVCSVNVGISTGIFSRRLGMYTWCQKRAYGDEHGYKENKRIHFEKLGMSLFLPCLLCSLKSGMVVW